MSETTVPTRKCREGSRVLTVPLVPGKVGVGVSSAGWVLSKQRTCAHQRIQTPNGDPVQVLTGVLYLLQAPRTRWSSSRSLTSWWRWRPRATRTGRTWWRCCSPASRHSGHGRIDESTSDLFQRSTLVFIFGFQTAKKLTFSKEMLGWF